MASQPWDQGQPRPQPGKPAKRAMSFSPWREPWGGAGNEYAPSPGWGGIRGVVSPHRTMTFPQALHPMPPLRGSSILLLAPPGPHGFAVGYMTTPASRAGGNQAGLRSPRLRRGLHDRARFAGWRNPGPSSDESPRSGRHLVAHGEPAMGPRATAAPAGQAREAGDVI